MIELQTSEDEKFRIIFRNFKFVLRINATPFAFLHEQNRGGNTL